MSARLPAAESWSHQRREKGRIRRLLGRDHALGECGHAVARVAEVLTMMGPMGERTCQ